MSESLLLAPITQPGGLYPNRKPHTKRDSAGSRIRKSKFKKQGGKFQKRPELPPVHYGVTPYPEPKQLVRFKRVGNRYVKLEGQQTPFKNLPDKANSIYEDAYNSAKKRGLSDKRAAKSGWGAVKNAGYKKKAGKWVKGNAQTPHEQDETPGLQPREPLMRMGRGGFGENSERGPTHPPTTPDQKELYIQLRRKHPDLNDDQLWDMVREQVEEATPHLQPYNQPPNRKPKLDATTPDPSGDWPKSAGKEQRESDYSSPFPDRNPGHADKNPADLTLEELRQREKKAHPNLSDEELDNLVKLHIRELGPPSDKEHQDDYKRSHPKASRVLHFGVDTGIPISHRFRALTFGDSGDIKLIGTFLDYETTTNGWHIDPDEEKNIVAAPTKANVTVRVAHSKEPERVIGKYAKFQANEDDGCVDAYGNELGRHIDFEAVVNPQDPQLRTNILKGWVNDISPGLDAEVFCGECGEPWGLDQASNKLVKTCEHQDAEGILRNIKPKEGSIVTEPAFEGRTRFHPTFTFGMAMNGLFSQDEYESEPVGSRLKGHATHDRRQTKGGIKMTQIKMEGSDASKLATRLYQHGFFTASEAKKLSKLHFLKAEDEDEDSEEDEDEDEDARIRAAFPLLKKAMSRAKNYSRTVKSLFEDEDEDKDEDARMEDEDEDESPKPYKAEDRAEDEDEDRMEDEDEDRAEDNAPDQNALPNAGDPYRDTHPEKPPVTYPPTSLTQSLGKGQLGAMSKQERRKIMEARKILINAAKTKLLNEADALLAKQKLRTDMTVLQEARKRFEQEKDTTGILKVDEHIAHIKAQLEPKVDKTSQGAQTPSSTPVIATKAPASKGTTPAALRAAFNAELAPAILSNPRFTGLKFKEAPQ